MKKRIISFVMALAMIVGLAGLVPEMNIEIKANADGNIVIAGVDIGYSSGSYFTKNGQSCATMASHWSNGRCHKNGVCDAATSPYCNCMRYWPTGNPNNCQVDLLSSQCFGFARYCEWRVYGHHDGQSNSGFYTALGSVSASTCTAGYLKEKLYGIAAASHLRTGDGGHSISIVTTSDTGITWADCNSDGYCKVLYHSDSWSSFSDYIKRRSGISYIYAYKNGIPSNSDPTPLDPDKLLKEKYGDPVDLGANFYAYIEHQESGLYLTSSDNNIVGSSVAGAKNQIWHFVKLKNGAYKIQCKADNRFMDVYGSYDADDTNVYTWPEYTGATNQQFYIYSAYGAYYIRPAHTKTRMLDLSGASDHNLELWGMGTDWAPQEFNIKKISFNGYLPTNLGNSFYANVEHQSSGFYLTNQSSNIAGEKQNGTSNQVWKFTRLSNGAYKIQSSLDNGIMDVWGSYDTDDANIYVCNKDTGAENQQFFIYKAYDAYYLRPVYSWTRMLDMESASPNNLELWTEGTDWSPQEFNIIKCDAPVNIGDDFSALILNADAESKPWKPIMQTNDSSVQLGTEKNTNYDATLWHFKRNSDDGTYAILSYKNEKALDVNKSKDENGAGVICYKYAGSNNQRWTVYKRSDGTFYLRPKCSATRVLDVKGGSTEDNTPVQLYTSNDSTTQCFSIYQLDKTRDKLSYKISADKKTVQQNQKTNISISGTLPYVYKFKIHVIDPDNKETVKDNGPSPVYSFSGSKVGKYIIFAEAISPLYTNSGSATKKCVTINVTCAHSITSTPAKAATCTANGNTAYWYCSKCKKYFSDKNCTKEITKASTVIAKTGHKTTATAAKPATCTTDGNIAYWYCSNCKKYFSDKNCTKEITKASTVIAKTGHKATAYAAKPAACTTDGNTAYWYCSNCKKYFSDKNCTKEITKASTVIAKTGHKYVSTIVPPTCTEKGYTLHKCSVCGEEYKDTETNASGHKYTSSVTKKASCTEDGTMTYTCDCGDSYTEIIKAAGHKYETATTPPTDTEAGYDEHICSVCGDSYKDNIIPANGHSYTSEITKPASCTEDGLKTFTCTSCGDTYTEIIKATGHEYVSTIIPPDCSSDGYTVHICKKCNDSYTDERIKALGHKYVDTVIAPTATEQGYTHHKCSVCGDEYDDTFVDPIKEEAITLDIILNANDQAMSSESISISIDGEAALTSENGKASLALADGIHKITFSAHGFVPRTYTVEVKNGKLTEEFTPALNLIGDADGNGVINTLDIVKLKRHIINIEPLTGYALDCANTDGNDTVNTLDIVKLKRHLINVETLW